MNDGRIPIVVDIEQGDIRGARYEESFEMRDGSLYTALYRYARYGPRWVRVLESVTETMPPRTPQVASYGPECRLLMMEDGRVSWTLEAEQRRREWAEVNK